MSLGDNNNIPPDDIGNVVNGRYDSPGGVILRVVVSGGGLEGGIGR